MLRSMSSHNVMPPIHTHYIYPESILRNVGLLQYKISDKRQDLNLD